MGREKANSFPTLFPSSLACQWHTEEASALPLRRTKELLSLKVFCILLQIPDVNSALIHTRLKRNPLENWVILFFSGQKPCTRITSSIFIIAPFFTLFKGYKSNKLYETTPTKRFLWELEKTSKASNFTKWNLTYADLLVFAQFLWDLKIIFSGSHKQLSLVL